MKLESLKPGEYGKLVKRVEQFCKDCQDKNGESPKFRVVAKRYHINLDDVETIIQDSDDLDQIVGFRSGQGGIAEIELRGDYLVEYIE